MLKPKKILIIGSGGLSIGQAGEFDYSGSQAIKALKETGARIILINPNIATIQTTPGLADAIYYLPLTAHSVIEVIKKERPDSITASFGGQVALNLAVELFQRGLLKKYGLKVLGTPIESVIDTENRARFVSRLRQIGVLTPRSAQVTSVADAIQAAQKIKFPIMIRAGFALGGKGSRSVQNLKELTEAATIALATSPHILIEEYLGGWKEIEYEVMRDRYDNCITVCNMENLDPLGIHTGESIVVTPSQTLSNEEYHELRNLSLKVIRHLKIVGECNIQFALNPRPRKTGTRGQRIDYRVIEVNARLSRSSALASKASGYPIAFMAAKLALGHSLHSLINAMSQTTTACFEPALDYVVVKMPRWDLNKFELVSRKVGSEMKSVGEVMAIGKNFEEAIQKACRMINTGMRGLVGNGIIIGSTRDELMQPTDLRIFAIERSLKRGVTPQQISDMTGIDRWFIDKIQNIVSMQLEMRGTKSITPELILRAKKLGFSDAQIAYITKKSAESIRALRIRHGIRPVVKQIDTLAAEYPAHTNYLYLTYHGCENDLLRHQAKTKSAEKKSSVIVLGGGPYSIGSSVEFDWCCVTAGLTIQKSGLACIMVNSNPETVSTDYDMFEKLYFEELTEETVLEIYERERPRGVIISVGGQIPNTLALPLSRAGVKILGTSSEDIDRAEDRHKFSRLLDTLGVDQPLWQELRKLPEARAFAERVGYPVLVRPSYVLSGAAMRVATDAAQLERYLTKAANVSPDQPVVISKFITNAKEIEFDAVARNGDIIAYAISEHIENAGVHSGDATLVFPAQKLYVETIRRIKKISREIAKALNINGPFNIQYLARDNDIKVIECNLRASRTFPFISKVVSTNFIELSTRVILGEKTDRVSKSVFDLDHVGVKAPQFSFTRLRGADPVLGVEMLSTGEVACIDHDFYVAFLKALAAADTALPIVADNKTGILLSINARSKSEKLIYKLRELTQRGVRLYATPETQRWLSRRIKTETAYFSESNKTTTVRGLFERRSVNLVINAANGGPSRNFKYDYLMRRQAVDYGISLITDLNCALTYFEAILDNAGKRFEILPLDQY